MDAAVEKSDTCFMAAGCADERGDSNVYVQSDRGEDTNYRPEKRRKKVK